MDYLSAINLVFSIITTILGILLVYNTVFNIVGIFTRKKYPKAKKKLKYAILVAARDEEEVIGNFINSVRSTNYPQENLDIFVIAHNCTDSTATIAKLNGAFVYEYSNKDERTKGYALRYLVNKIKKDYGIESYDGYFIFDADNILCSNYFEKMNDAFIANDQNEIITSYRNSKNFGSSLISGMYGVYFLIGCVFEQRGRTALNCSTRVTGTGYMVPPKVLQNGWNYLGITEDWELTADRLISGEKIKYCDEAVFYDEQPTDISIMFRQRIRWSKGYLLVFLSRFKEIFKNIFSKERKNRFSLYDFSTKLIPLPIIYFLISFIQIALTCLSPCFSDTTLIDILDEYYFHNIFTAFLSTYLMSFLQGIIILITEVKRIRNVSMAKRFLFVLFWPFFSMIQVVIDFIALFSKSVEWKVIPHKDKTEHEAVNKSN